MGAVKIKRGSVPKPRMKAKIVQRAAAPKLSPMAKRALVFGSPVVVVVGFGLAAWAFDWPARTSEALALNSAAAGFEIRHVEVVGAREVPRLKVYEAVLSGPSNPMLATDLGAIRDKLRQLPWVADASVSRRLPDTMVVSLSERKPVAVWQNKGQFRLIDITGQVLATDRLDRFAELPLVVGTGANQQVRELLDLASAAPALATQMEAGVLVGRRRWNLRFKTGETLALPDTPEGAKKALMRFAAIEAELPEDQKLLSGRFERFDLRVPGQMTVGGAEVKKAIDAAAKAAASQKPATI